MNLPHAHTLYIHGSSVVHRASAPTKVVLWLAFVLSVAAIPRTALPVFGVGAAVILSVALIARLRIHVLTSRLIVEAPFVAFAAFLPFFGGGEHVRVAGIEMSVEGAWAAWGILAKATLCVAASVIVVATTTVPDLLSGLLRLRVPRVMVSIAGFMMRYLDLLVAEWQRMRCAMAIRGYDPHSIVDAEPLAKGGAALFVRAHERGERVHGAMVARGYQGATR